MEDKGFKKPEDRFVLKRGGRSEKIDFRKIRERLQRLALEHRCVNINLSAIVELVERSVVLGIRTSQLDRNAANACSLMGLIHSDYTRLAGAIAVSNLHKETTPSFIEALTSLSSLKDVAGRNVGIIDPGFLAFVSDNQEAIQKEINHARDFTLFSHEAILLLEKQYLLKDLKGVVLERPQHMWMRAALALHLPDLQTAFTAYHDMSKGLYSVGSTTLMQAGCRDAMLLSHYNYNMGDSLDLIYETVRNTGLACSKGAAVGVTVADLRCAGSIIRKTNGTSTGLVPMLRVMNEVAYTYNMGGRRPAALTVYVEPWHNDVEKVLELKKKGGSEELRARAQEYALLVPDLFMERVRDDQLWSFFCPDECQGLTASHGPAFKSLYQRYEREGRARHTIKAKDLWLKILNSIMTNGAPKILFKHALNEKSNLIDPIQAAGYNGELAYSVTETGPVGCPSASLSLPAFFNKGEFDMEAFQAAVRRVVRSLNYLIDKTVFAPMKAKEPTMQQRPLAIGVQGMADLVSLLQITFDSEENIKLNERVLKGMYYAAVDESCKLAEEQGAVTVPNKLMGEKGPVFLFEQSGVQETGEAWEALRERVRVHGVRNAVMLALSKTTNTSVLLGNMRGVEVPQGNLVPFVLGDEYVSLKVNPHLQRELIQEGEWNAEMQEQLLMNEGSLASIPGLHESFKKRYKGAWELPQKVLMELAEARAPYICQSQAMTVSLGEKEREKVNAMLFWAWKRGLKTGLSSLQTEQPHISKALLQQMRGLVQAAAGNDTLKMVRYMSPHAEAKRASSQTCSLRPANLGADEACLMCGS